MTPRVLPPVRDYPEEYLPESLPSADLILSLAKLPGVALADGLEQAGLLHHH